MIPPELMAAISGSNNEDARGVAAEVDALAEYIGMPRGCRDSMGAPLKVGDVLSGGTLSEHTHAHDDDDDEDKCAEANQDKKAVLEIGWRWAKLSRTFANAKDTEAKTLDGKWYEASIKKRKWVKQQ